MGTEDNRVVAWSKPGVLARDVLLAVVCLLIPQGWSMSGFPPSIVWACVCWAGAAILLIHASLAGLPRISKKIKIPVVIVSLAMVVWRMWTPVVEEYRRENARLKTDAGPSEIVKSTPVDPKPTTEQAQVIHPTEAPVSAKTPAKPKKKQEPPKVYQPPASSPTGVLVQPGATWNSTDDTVSAPNGTAIENRGKMTSKGLSVNPTPYDFSLPPVQQLQEFIDESHHLSDDSSVAHWRVKVMTYLHQQARFNQPAQFWNAQSNGLAAQRDFLIKLKDEWESGGKH